MLMCWSCSAGERLLPLADRRLEAGDHLLLRVTRPDLLRSSRITPFN